MYLPVGALNNYSLVFLIFIIFFGQLKDSVGQVLFLVSCPKGQVEKYVNVEACHTLKVFIAIFEKGLLVRFLSGITSVIQLGTGLRTFAHLFLYFIPRFSVSG
jgi:hypothetical protein